jgi:hypothetical protein
VWNGSGFSKGKVSKLRHLRKYLEIILRKIVCEYWEERHDKMKLKPIKKKRHLCHIEKFGEFYKVGSGKALNDF